MFKHYLLIAWRNLRRNRLLSVIQILCLSVGMATFIMIFRYVQYEQDWDKFNTNFERIYRIQLDWKDARSAANNASFPAMAKYFEDNYPEVEKAVLMWGEWPGYLSTSPERTYYEEKGYFATNEVFDVFTFELLTGNKGTALNEPYTIVLSKTLAEKYFPDEDPMGKIITDGRNIEYRVTGIMKDIPKNSHITPSYFYSMASRSNRILTSWDNLSYLTYVLLKNGVDVDGFNARIKSILDQHVEANQHFVYLNPLKELHLNSSNDKDHITEVFFYSVIGILILILASLNFANLTTAFSTSRAKEIGIRKVNGGGVGTLQKQFLAEAIILAFISLLFALLLVWMILPFFNNIVQRDLPLDFFSNPLFLVVILGSTLITGFISGIYPAFMLSRFKPVVILKGYSPVTRANGRISGLKILITAQFIITAVLLSSTVWTFRQVQYLKNISLGFNKSGLLHCKLPPNNSERDFEELKALALRIPGVENITISITAPFHSHRTRRVIKEGASADDWVKFNYNNVSPEFMETYEMQLKEGRFFLKDKKSDEKACVINSTGARALGWEKPLGKRLNIDDEWYDVIGVLNDFHFFWVATDIYPYLMKLFTDDLSSGSEITIRISDADHQQTIAGLDNLFRTNFMNSIFTINYFDDRADKSDIEAWQTFGRTSAFFTLLAIFIAAVGIFGMVAYTTRKRMKEIGIRRVQGAKSFNIIALVVKEFFFLLLIATLFVFPVPYLLVKVAPGSYKYQMNLWEFFVIIGMMLIIAVVASSYEAIKATSMNPVKSLRYE